MGHDELEEDELPGFYQKSQVRMDLWKNSRSSLALMVPLLLFPSCGICWWAVRIFFLSNYSASTLLPTRSWSFPQRFHLFIPRHSGSVFSPMPKMTWRALLTRSDQIWNLGASPSIRGAIVQDLIQDSFYTLEGSSPLKHLELANFTLVSFSIPTSTQLPPNLQSLWVKNPNDSGYELLMLSASVVLVFTKIFCWCDGVSVKMRPWWQRQAVSGLDP